MASVPDELQQPPPRDPIAGKDIFANNGLALMGASIATFAILPAIVLGNWRQSRDWDPLDPSMIFGYGWTFLAMIVLVVVFLRWLRVRSVYREGILTEASIETLRFDPVGPANTRATMDLRYVASGQERRRRVAISGVLDDTILSQGGTIPILVHPRNVEHIGVYTRMTGLVIPLRYLPR